MNAENKNIPLAILEANGRVGMEGATQSGVDRARDIIAILKKKK